MSFRVERGEILGFLGPNGAGKTTTMRILTGYMPATEGKAIVAGYDVFDQPVEAKRRTGYLPETPPLYPDMTVLRLPDLRRRRSRACRRLNASSASSTSWSSTRIADMAGRLCGRLSKGYKQRVGLAQALIHNPDVLILDEPTAGLDPKQIIETRQLIKELAGDHTIILSTHILPEVSQTCQRVVIISKGHVVAVDTPDNLTARLRGSVSMYVQVDAADGDAAAALSKVPGVTRRRGIRSARQIGRLRSGQRAGPRHPPRPRADGCRSGLGAARAAADARQPRGDLPLAHHRGHSAAAGRRGGDRSCVTSSPSRSKELQSYFASPIAYMVIGLFALLYGYFFAVMLQYFVRAEHEHEPMQGQQAMNINQDMLRPVLQNVTVLLLFVLPAMTMRTYSEERRSRHDRAAADLADHRPGRSSSASSSGRWRSTA